MTSYVREASEIRAFTTVLTNACEDLSSGDYEVTGKLCEDIAALGYGQEVAVETLFSSRSVLRSRLAARVCESCVSWLDCEIRIFGDLRIDERDPFLVADENFITPDDDLAPIVTPTMRQY